MEQIQIKEPELIRAFRWLQDQLSNLDHGSLSLELNIYDGHIGTVNLGRSDRKKVSRQ